MKKLIGTIMAFVVTLLIGWGANVAATKVQDLPEINQVFLQKEADKRLPMTGNKLGVNYTISDVDIRLKDNIAVDFVVALSGHGYKGKVRATMIGVPRWDKSKKAFYLTSDPTHPQPITFHELTFKKNWLQRGKDALNINQGIVERIVRSKVDNILFNDARLKEAATRAITAYLAQFPIAHLPRNGVAWKIAAVALDDVTIVDDTVHIKVSFWALTQYVLMLLFVFALSTILSLWLALSGSGMLTVAAIGAAIGGS